jgi:hypothetical protein
MRKRPAELDVDLVSEHLLVSKSFWKPVKSQEPKKGPLSFDGVLAVQLCQERRTDLLTPPVRTVPPAPLFSFGAAPPPLPIPLLLFLPWLRRSLGNYPMAESPW